jgi:hypothetical protein
MDIRQILFQCFQWGVPLAVAAAIFGIRWKEGLWSNILSVFAVLFSALIAVGWWESLASFLSSNAPSMLFLSDTIAIWLLFLVSLLIISELTKLTSRVKVKFADPVEKAGNALALAALFLSLYGFYLFALDLSPVGENEDAEVSGDSIQIQMLRILTAGNLSSFTEPTQFDANGDFRQRHLQRRQAILENVKTKEGSLFYEGEIPPRRD